jgi:1-acyl-sn-glycerol-3-phosphate acyltransferase
MIFLRSLTFNLWFYGTTFVLALASIGRRLFGRNPEPLWAMGVANLWARLVLSGLRQICKADWVVTGRENLPASGPMLIASMHQSAFDTMVWLLLVPHACYVLKRELLAIPVFGAMVRMTGMIAVDRGAGSGAIRSLLRGADRAVAEQRQIIIFPEGTRAAPGAQLPLQPGIAALAARTGLPVIPVATDSGYCWGRRAFRKRPGTIHIAIGKPIPAGLSREELMRRLETAFTEGLSIGGQAVDNSVGQPVPSFAKRPNAAQ